MTAQAWVTLAIGIVGIVGVIATVRQRLTADLRSAWWSRAQWALDQTHDRDDDDIRGDGWAALGHLTESAMITPDDQLLLTAIAVGRRHRHNERNGPEVSP